MAFGIAGTCPVLADGVSSKLSLKAGKYEINNWCLEPSSFQVKLPPTEKQQVTEFERTKLMTRLTYTLDAISADLNVGGDGSWAAGLLICEMQGQKVLCSHQAVF